MLLIAAASTFTGSASAQEGPPETSSDAQAWALRQPETPWATPKASIDADRWDLGGTLLPSVQTPVLLTDPFATRQAGYEGGPSFGYGLEWRVGYALSNVSLEGLGGLGRSSRDPVTLPSGRRIDLTLDRVWLGGQLRYTFVNNSRWAPFAGAGATAEYWSIDTVFRPNGKYVSANALLVPSIHVMAGTRLRLVRIGSFATLFGEVGVKIANAFAGEMSGDDQVFVSPWLGFSLMGARPPLFHRGRGTNEHAAR